MLDITTAEVSLETRPRIIVIGVGGAGGNAVDNMIAQNLEGCEFLTINTDAQALKESSCDKKIQLGAIITKGLGAGANPEIGRKSAEETIEEIGEYIDGANMVFIACGMGGGTGTGAAPVIAQYAREKGILTVGVVTKPFDFEGSRRMKQADLGIIELQKYVDTLIIIPNQNLFYEVAENTSLSDAFRMVDDVLYRGVRGVTDLMIKPGLINLDFNDIRTVMSEKGKAMMGTGESDGAERAFNAAENAISNKLLDDDNMKGATAALINITASQNVSLPDVTYAVDRIRQELSEDANIIFGTTIDETMGETFRVSIVATGIDVDAQTTTIDLNLETPQAGILFGEKSETSETFLDALQTGGETEKTFEPTPDFIGMNDVPTMDTTDISAPLQNEEQKMQQPNMTPTQDTTNTPLLDPFFEADLANASQNGNTMDTPTENISEDKVKKGGFFKSLFGNIKEIEKTPVRTAPVVETPAKTPTPTPTINAPSQPVDDYNNSLGLNNQQQDKKNDDMDIPDFLKKQID